MKGWKRERDTLIKVLWFCFNWKHVENKKKNTFDLQVVKSLQGNYKYLVLPKFAIKIKPKVFMNEEMCKKHKQVSERKQNDKILREVKI